ncbi:MAG: hypothetical protein II863_04960 [Kiritimatiellae bacterium]|nr:hypothetical protein [Kiritimatiellia bacterium]
MKSGNNAVLIYQDDNGVSSVKAVREPTVHGGEPTDGDNPATFAPREA